MRKIITMLLVVGAFLAYAPLALAAPASQAGAAPARQALDPACLEWLSGGSMHHQLAPWVPDAVASGGFRAWRSGSTLIIAFKVTACAGKWMFAKFAGNELVTNFFPDRGLGYIVGQARGWSACAYATIRTAVRAAAALAAGMETVFTLILVPESLCALPGSHRLPQCTTT